MQPSEHFLKTYAELIYDLCVVLLNNASSAKIVFRNIFQNIRAQQSPQQYITYERAWVLHVAAQALIEHYPRFGKKPSQEERISLESGESAGTRLEQWTHFFTRLEPQDQILLLLHDRYGIHGAELAAALNTPTDSLKMRRQQALQALEEWIWKQK